MSSPARHCRTAGWLLLVSLLLGGALHAQAIEPLPFKNRAETLRFQHLTAQLRCLQCQNESLADSNAPLAHDLRDEVFEQMQAGKTDQEIKRYLVARYSDFVLYDPPLKASTWLLWFGPLLILLAGAAFVITLIRRRGRGGVPAADIASEDEW